ncbi:hypothetical protein F2P81_008911 [Scophthalmus maximus]|uniref:Uncharacterized protein n=1 Tax=Scophthalmus maximus TaxID=52904 RepID=A0A6A4SXV3_SCOMX|nr:hypothetical protein F2P81_008911 [Scophthalmus maximus]
MFKHPHLLRNLCSGSDTSDKDNIPTLAKTRENKRVLSDSDSSGMPLRNTTSISSSPSLKCDAKNVQFLHIKIPSISTGEKLTRQGSSPAVHHATEPFVLVQVTHPHLIAKLQK